MAITREALLDRIEERLLKLDWEIPVLDMRMEFPETVDFIAFHPKRGPVGVVAHVRDNKTKYCVRQSQINACFEWDGPVYIVFENAKVCSAVNMKMYGTPCQGLYGYPDFYQLETEKQLKLVYSFNAVFK